MSRISFLHDIFSSVFTRGDTDAAVALDDGAFVELCEALLSERGEMSGSRLARSLLGRFETASPEERVTFLELLATRFDIDAGHALRAAERHAATPSAANLARLIEAVEPRRLELLRRVNRLPGATVRLVRMRERLLELLPEHPELARIDADFRHLFRSWFNQGFLVLREIDWSTPANILEKIIAYEAVHAIGDWAALRMRLEPPDRRCFAFFHPAMADEPLIFVEVALTRSNPRTVREVLWPERPTLEAHEVDTAVFYSISNCQRGLAGVSFGNFLIKQVASELSRELPGLDTFRTLSPVPGLMRWVDARLDDGVGTAGTRLPTADRPASDTSAAEVLDAALVDALALARRIAANEPPTASDGTATAADDEERRQHLRRLVAHFLAHAKRADGQPLDPVARFHLGNGASLDDVLADADASERALAQSAGVMVSYLYDLERVEANHESYAHTRRVVVTGEAGALLEPPRRSRRRA